METHSSPNWVSLLCECKAVKTCRSSNFERPPNISRPLNNSLIKWDTTVPRANFSCDTKIVLKIQSSCSWSCCSFPSELASCLSSIWRWRQSNPLSKLARASKHQQHDQIAHWIFDGDSCRFCHVQNRIGNSNCNLSRVREDPSRPLLVTVLKITTVLSCFTLPGNTIVTRTCWNRPARLWSQPLYVAHPRGEKHELVNT